MRKLTTVTLICLLFAVMSARAADDDQSLIQANPRIDLPPQTDMVRAEVAPAYTLSTSDIEKVRNPVGELPQVCRDAIDAIDGSSALSEEERTFWLNTLMHCLPQVSPMIMMEATPAVMEASLLTPAVAAVAPDVVTRVAAGFAQFVFTRAQTEVVAYVTTDFGVRLCTRSFNGYDVKSYFPDSCDVLTGQGSLYQKDVDVQQLGAALQTALQSDLIRLIPVVINSASDQQSPAVSAIIAAVLKLAPPSGGPPATANDVLDALASVSVMCTGGTDTEKLTCASFSFTVAVIKAVREAEESGCADDTACRDEALRLLNLDTDPARRMVEQVIVFMKRVRSTHDPLKDNLFTRVSLLRDAWKLVVTYFIPSAEQGPHLELAQRFDQHFFRQSPLVNAIIAAAVKLAPTGGSPKPTADDILDALASLDVPCDIGTPNEKEACEAFRLTVAAIKAVRDAEKSGCQGTAACLEAALANLNLQGENARHIAEQVMAFAQDVRRTYKSGSRVDNLFTRVSLARRAWQLVVETAIPEEQREPHLELLRRFDQHFFRWHEVGLMMFRTVDALRRQRNPVEVIVAATEELQCTGVGDVRCGLQLVGIAAQAITVATDENGKVDPVKAKTKFLEYVNGKKDKNLDAWLAAFIQEKTKGSQPITEYINAVIQPIENLLRLVAQARALRDDPRLMPQQRRIQLGEIAVQLVDAALALWQTVLPDTIPSTELQRIAALVRHFNDMWKAAEERDFPRLIASLYPLAADLGVREPIPAPLRRYVPLITGLASAKTSADYTAVLQTYAAPAGSWREKRRQPFTVALNSYLGAAGGIIDGTDTREIAVFLPLGLDLAWPRFRAFVSLADVGNVAALRSGKLEVPEKVSLDDLIAPGIFLNVPLGRSPFVAGISAVQAPFDVPGADGAPATKERGIRLSIVVAIDVPILTLFKRGESP